MAILLLYSYNHYFSTIRQIVIEEGITLQKDLYLDEGNLLFKKNSTLEGKIEMNQGEIMLEKGVKIKGSIHIKNGSLKIKGESLLEGDIFMEKGVISIGSNSVLKKSITVGSGSLKIGENVEIEGNINVTSKVKVEKHSSALIHGTKPKVYKTYDWPLALQYFDILPESHKEQVGFIILTKEKNGLIRGENILNSLQYFDGIYDYKAGKLIPIDLSDSVLMERFFNKAKSFFTELPERRMVYFNVGATTKNYAHDPAFADIYLPSQGSGTLLIHEMGHVMDYKSDFSDLHEPKYPWTREDAVSSYGATHPGEDFAEAYRLYMMNEEGFLALIKENPERQKKYDFLKEYVFN